MMTKTKIHCWGIGISPDMQSMLTEYFGQTVSLQMWSQDRLPSQTMFETSRPVAIFISPSVEQAIKNLSPAARQPYTETTRVCILPEHYSQDDLELGIGSKAAKILPHDASKKDILHILHTAYESRNIPEDIQYMTRELLLDRELLERKNSLLSFLVAFFGKIAQAESVAEAFEKSFDALSLLFPLETLHGATWFTNAVSKVEATLFINAAHNSPSARQWEKALRSHILDITNNPHLVIRERETIILPQGENLTPGEVHAFPLHFGGENEVQGIILLASHTAPQLGRDQSESLATALNHFSTIITNHYYYHLAKTEANIDPLTGLNNRRGLMHSLRSEVTRSKRYETPLSVMMLDLDHFKRINDTHGHQAGDKVLHQVGNILKETLRTTDLPYRYGGEEFCVIMPETSADKAYIVAERLREKIASYPFAFQDGILNVTISIGITGLGAGASDTPEALLSQADELLYTAKNKGRNCTEVVTKLLEVNVV